MHKVFKTLTGKVRVKYQCPHCSETLESELAEAGSTDICPQCQKKFVVPGEAERTKFEAQLRQQAQTRKEAEAIRTAQLQQQKAEEAKARAMQAAIDAEDAIRTEAQEAEQTRAQALAERATAQRRLGTPENTQYRALELYIGILQTCGFLCIAALAISIVGGALTVLLMFFMYEENRANVDDLIVGYLYFACVAAVATLPPALMFFVMSQMIQLALDARRDLAKLVAQRNIQ